MSKAGRADVQIPSAPGQCGKQRGDIDLDMSRLVLNPAGIPGCPAFAERNAVYFSWHCEFRWRKAAYVNGSWHRDSVWLPEWRSVASRVFAVIGGGSRARLSPLCRPLIPACSVKQMMDNVFFRECQNSIADFWGVWCFMEARRLSRCPWCWRASVLRGDSSTPPPEGTDMEYLRPSLKGIESQVLHWHHAARYCLFMLLHRYLVNCTQVGRVQI